MSVDVTDSLRNGFHELLSPRGLVVGGLLLLHGLGNLVVQQSIQLRVREALFRALNEVEGQEQAVQQVGPAPPFALEVAVPLLVALLLALVVFEELARLVGIRLFASDAADPLPFDDVARGFGDAALKAVVLGGAVSLAIAAVALIPLLGWVVSWAIMLAFVYLRQAIALGDRGWVDTVRESLSLFAADPAPIAAVLLLLGAVGAVLTGGVPFLVVLADAGATPAGLGAPDQGPQVVGALARVVLGAVVQALGVAVVTDAYLQAAAGEEAAEEAPAATPA